MGSVSPYTNIEVAVYKGDELICMGKITQCAKELRIQAETLYFYLMPTYERRISKRKHSSDNIRRVVRI